MAGDLLFCWNGGRDFQGIRETSSRVQFRVFLCSLLFWHLLMTGGDKQGPSITAHLDYPTGLENDGAACVWLCEFNFHGNVVGGCGF